ncbi:hypothetical protein WHY64_09385 [Clostridium perfringens]|uniref:hypothetical protein n=1 Tax=Clostridium perfringens TaxID=1502 RepID=UPI001CB4884E|nr:hypothetical protein [Clostridium perfringens]HBI7018512.1 hypothetical protein [Clostridium perfringens]HBI7020784.1 hypothetical protein [Clostridium perfringens]HBI7378592.1 hypothetical protein [Clostridium perfringens]
MSCDFCRRPYGKEFEVKESLFNLEQPDKAFVLIDGDKPEIVLTKRGSSSGYFDIKYCPFCGEKL